MKRTVELDEKLVEEAEKVAAASGRTLTALLEDAVRAKLDDLRDQESDQTKLEKLHRTRVVLPVFHGGGPRPGVNLDSNVELQDLMDQDDPFIQRIVREQRLLHDPEYAARYRRLEAEMPTFGEGGLLPGVDLDDHAAMDERDGLNDHP